MSDYRKIIADQRMVLERMLGGQMTFRETVKKIDLESPLAQVVIGMRRCGKSVLCRMALAMAKASYGYVNFDDENLRGTKAENLNDILEGVLAVYGDIKVLFLDEIQNVDGWELFVNRMLRQGLHLLVTGSNSKLLSSELATHLTGRHMPIELFSFSFAEYRKHHGRERLETTADMAELRRDYEKYSLEGGLPETFVLNDIRGYIAMLFSNIIRQDVIRRHHLRNCKAFEDVAQVVMESYANEISYRNIAKRLGLQSIRAVQNYIGYLEDAYLVEALNRYSKKSAQRRQIGKIYVMDPGLITYFSGISLGNESRGRRLENLVFLKLRRQSLAKDYRLYYYQDEKQEIDFVLVRHGRIVKLIQVSFAIDDSKTRKREISALFNVAKQEGCHDLLLITDHDSGLETKDGMTVSIVEAPQWLAFDDIGIDSNLQNH